MRRQLQACQRSYRTLSFCVVPPHNSMLKVKVVQLYTGVLVTSENGRYGEATITLLRRPHAK
jgi:hypothetical protein